MAGLLVVLGYIMVSGFFGLLVAILANLISGKKPGVPVCMISLYMA